jgi:nucleoside-diphosphate-sugar epimerase
LTRDEATHRGAEGSSGPTVAVTGGTGFVGSHLRAALHGTPVVLLGRREPGLMGNERWLRMDLAKPILPGGLDRTDVLCHLAYAMKDGRENVLHNRRLLDAVNANPNIRRVVLISSTSVYGASDAQLVDEESPCNPVGEYAETKLACETVWLEGLREDCGLTVLRPTEVVGPGGRGLLPLIRDALHRPVVAAVKRSLLYHRPLHYVAVSNVVAAVLFCLGRTRKAAREVYVVSDDHQPENRSYAVMQDAVRRIAGRRALPGVAMPRRVLPVLGKVTGRPLYPGQIFSSRRLHAAGFEDAAPLVEEVERLVRSVGGATVGGSMG